MITESDSRILVLTDTPGIYGSDLYRGDQPPVYVKNVKLLLERMAETEFSGLVLEVPKVMKADRRDRDRLFEYAGRYPVLRTRPNVRHGFMVYLDPREVFFENIEKSEGKWKRNFERVPVELPCQIARENDPSMADVRDAIILDISPGGCFIKTNPCVGNEAFVNLRIPSLGNNRPIYASVRWSRSECNDGCGMGLLFIDLTDDQAQAIAMIG